MKEKQSGRPASPSLENLSRREREIFEILVAEESATLNVILDKMAAPPTRQAVRALLVVMEDKGYISRERIGREYLFRPAVSGNAAARSLMQNLLDKVFGSSLKDALSSHLEDDNVNYSEKELREIAELFEKKRSKKPKS